MEADKMPYERKEAEDIVPGGSRKRIIKRGKREISWEKDVLYHVQEPIEDSEVVIQFGN